MPSTVEAAAHAIARGLKLVDRVVTGDSGPRMLLGMLGWDLPSGVDDIGLRALDFSDLLDKLGSLDLALSVDASGVTLAGDYAALFTSLTTHLAKLDGLVGSLVAPGNYLAQTGIVSKFCPRLLDFVVVELLTSTTALPVSVAAFVGVVELKRFRADASIFQVTHVRRIVHWDRIPGLFSDPRSLMRDVYAWGSPAFDSTPLVIMLGALLSGISVATRTVPLPRRAEHSLVGVDVAEADTAPMTQLLLSLSKGFGFDPVDAGLSIVALRPTATGGSDGGIALVPYLHGTTDLQFPIDDQLTFAIDSNLDVKTGVAMILRAGSSPKFRSNLLASPTPTETNNGSFAVSLSWGSGSAAKLSILAAGVGIGFEAQRFTISGGAAISGGVLSPQVLARLTGGHFFLDGSQMDSFLAKIIPISIDVNFDFGLGWSGAYGFFFEGSASPAVTIGLHQSVGPFTLDTLHVGLDVGQGDTLPLELSLSGKGELGPFNVSVDRIGLKVAAAFRRGNLGPVDLSLSFRPPNGLGMELDAGLISGGGYLFINEQKHRYAGVLECSIADIVQVKIIGVLDTVLPDGTPEFSLLLVITTEFPPIQLSFGFTLIGVGGIGGVNRTMAMDALRSGFRAHHLDSVMFPSDPIDNAPRIISDLSSFFPQADGRYVFGPMFELGWGTPTLISLSLGIILEIPDPVRLAILGLIKMALPSDDVALVEVHIDILGLVDFGAELLTIQGSMYDSRVTIFSMSGDLALMLAWGVDANFAFSLGGLNPRFQPPPNFALLKRCCVSIGDGDNPRFSSSNYFAVTSNSVQFGASVDLYAAAAGFSIHGWIGFDALFIFTPFSFIIEFSAGLDVEFEGETLCAIHVDGMLAGPRPWHVHGDAGFHILFIDISASVNLSFGDSDPVPVPSVKVLPDLEKALSNPQSWSAKMPTDATQAVSLAPRQPGDKTLVVHPMGTLEVREKVVPLGLPITKYGNGKPVDGTLFTISSVTVDNKPEAQQWLTDQFAIGQYTDLSDDQKLTAQSFKGMKSGISIGSSDVVTSRDVECVVAYQDGYIDGDATGMRLRKVYVLPADIHLAYCRLGAGFVSATRTKGVATFTPPGTVSAINSTDLQYVVASTEDLSLRADILSSPVTQFEAQFALGAYLAANPAKRGSVQVVAIHEVAA